MSERKTVSSYLLVAFVDGAKPAVLLQQSGAGMSGKVRTMRIQVPVIDLALYRGLKSQVAPGNEVDVTIETEWAARPIRKSLVSFQRPASTGSSGTSGFEEVSA